MAEREDDDGCEEEKGSDRGGEIEEDSFGCRQDEKRRRRKEW